MPDLPEGQYWEVVVEDNRTYWGETMHRNQPFLLLKEDVIHKERILGIFPVETKETVVLERRPLKAAVAYGSWQNYPIIYNWKSMTPEDIEATAKHILDFRAEEERQKEVASALLVKYPPEVNYYTLKDTDR
jgi:hypothetical protein